MLLIEASAGGKGEGQLWESWLTLAIENGEARGVGMVCVSGQKNKK